MNILDRELKPWLHGVVSVLLGFCVLWSMITFPELHFTFVDGVNSILYYPEKPAIELRNILKYSSNWVLERASLQERVTELEHTNRALSEEMQRSGIKIFVPKEGNVAAKVMLRYPDDWWHEFRIDKGRKDGIKEGAAVTSEGFLIGRVVRAGQNYAWVQMITSSSFLIAAAVDETRDLGVINGDDKGNLTLLYIPEERRLKNGMGISTSLMGKHVPPGIPIGRIIGVKESKDGFQSIRIQAGAHLTQLYSVEVYSGGDNIK
ncbi:MAG: rod shape-determining protein MreC [Synergistaceae bacterium]|nr:rod shape-determining protein MreC [Synergistaceae bacterium]